MRHELDDKFATLRELIYAPDLSVSIDGSKPPLDNDELHANSNAASDSIISKLLPHTDNYDNHVRDLAFDKRAKPKDRTKTDEELALEAKEALEKAEKKRRRRMLGLPESDSEGEIRKGRRRGRGADDLDDDFDHEIMDYDGFGAGLEGENLSNGEGGDDEEFFEEQEGSQVDLDDEKESEEEEEEEEDEDTQESTPLSKAARDQPKAGAKKELPFTFPCPENHEEFLEIVEELEDVDVCTVVQRIRTLYHGSLAPDNKFKLQVYQYSSSSLYLNISPQNLAAVLIDHILYVASPRMAKFSLISSLFPHILILTRTYPVAVAQHFNEKLKLIHKNLKRGLSRGALRLESKTWPGLPELSLLRIIGLIWSTSDLHHAVVSPARLIIGAYLGLCRVRSLQDIASGLFLTTLILQFEALSKRFVPEAVNFLTNGVLHLAPHQYEEVDGLPGSFPAPDFNSESCQGLRLDGKARKKLVMRKPDFNTLMSAEADDEQAKADLLSLTFELLGKFADMYKGIY